MAGLKKEGLPDSLMALYKIDGLIRQIVPSHAWIVWSRSTAFCSIGSCRAEAVAGASLSAHITTCVLVFLDSLVRNLVDDRRLTRSLGLSL